MSACIHCDQEALIPYFNKTNPSEGPFCCQGCLTVYNVIHFKGLEEYYNIKKNFSYFKKSAPLEIRNSQYTYMDDEDFLSEYSYLDSTNSVTMEFYLEGIHCLACLWIIEKIPEFNPKVKSSRLNMTSSVVTIKLKPGGAFSSIARELEGFGYRPHPLKINQSSQDLKTKEVRTMLLRIGIAGAASGNIMIYAISLYAGASHAYASLFNQLTVLFAIPVLTYCAFPFYRSSWMAIKNKDISIDIPISLALIVGGVMGIYNLLIGVHENYFDSLSALVFLLLLSRYFLKIIQEMGLNTGDLYYFYQGDIALKVDKDDLNFISEIHPKFIKVDDLIKIKVNSLIPADGNIFQGTTYLNNSLLTGESKLQKKIPGDEIYSGTMNMGSDVIIQVKKIKQETRLGRILKNVENGWSQKAHIVDITNKVSKYFVAVVFALSILLFIIKFQTSDFRIALEQALTLLIVTCPCALAIATPLAFIRTLGKASQKGIIIKDDSVIEKLSKIKNVFIDKTGTITENKLQIHSFKSLKSSNIPFYTIIYNLEKNSAHPIALSLMNFVKLYPCEDIKLDDFHETPGVGVSAKYDGYHYEIKDRKIFENSILICTFEAEDSIRPDAKNAITLLRNFGLNIKILSGDKKEYVNNIASQVGLNNDEYLAEISPEEKSNQIKQSDHSLMIGDGANDAIALSYADVGIAVFGAMDISMRASDVYLSVPGLNSVVELITISKETMKIIYRNLVLSLFYNSISIILAFNGYITPLAAAIIMPLSSLSVLISTLIGTKKLRLLWK